MMIWLFHTLFVLNTSAQITLDGTLGEKGPLSGPDYVISDDMGQRAGPNLFHSFGEFNVQIDESATFTGPADVGNIIGRVTGGSISWVDGIIRSDIPGADLFLLNPGGVMFGPNAFLDIHGSFYLSTADYLRLADGSRFDARHTGESLLSAAPPEAFGFLDENPAGIAVEGSFLDVPEEEILSLVGGDIRIQDGLLHSKNGEVHVISVASPGEVSVTEPDLDAFSALGSIELCDDSYIATTGEGEGEIIIRGGRFFLEDASVSATAQDGQGDGAIRIDIRDELQMTGGGEITSYGIDDGQGSPIIIEAGTLDLEDEASVNSACNGSAESGEILIAVRESISISEGTDFPSGIYSWTEGEGKAGDLSLTCKDLLITENGMISGEAYAEGEGPDMMIRVDHLELTEGGNIDNSSYGPGKGGDISIHARDTITIAGYGEYRSGIYAQAQGSGDAGSVSISGGSLHITREGVITGETYDDASGRGADVDIHVQALAITHGGEISVNTYGPGQGGDLSILADQSVTLSGFGGYWAGGIGAEAHGPGNAGRMAITTPYLLISDGAGISGVTQAEGLGSDIMLHVERLDMLDGAIRSSCLEGASGDGGDIRVHASESVLIEHSGSEESICGLFSMTGGNGNAGQISLSAPSLMIRHGGEIQASTAFGHGRAGDIHLDIGRLELTDESMISSSSSESSGQGGRIRITTEDAVLISGSCIMALSDGTGDAGHIQISARTLDLTEGGMIETLTGEYSSGNAGDIMIEVEDCRITKGGMINTSSLGSGKGGRIGVEASGAILISHHDDGHTYTGFYSLGSAEGDAGSIAISTPFLSITDRGACIMASTVGSGTGGDIRIDSTTVRIEGGAFIIADSSGTGDAGHIRINASDALSCNQSKITTEADHADGGNIQIHAQHMVHLRDSSITATVKGGSGDGGNIEIDPTFVILDKSAVIANAEGGHGGNIRIVSQVFLPSAGSILSASSRLGIDGRVEIDAQVFDLSSNLVVLPGAFEDLDTLLPRRCIHRHKDDTSYFLIKGRAGFPSMHLLFHQ